MITSALELRQRSERALDILGYTNIEFIGAFASASLAGFYADAQHPIHDVKQRYFLELKPETSERSLRCDENLTITYRKEANDA